MTVSGNIHTTVLEACELLFGQDVHVSNAFLGYLQHSGVKAAFRKRVKEQHPDVNGISAAGEHFIKIKESFDIVNDYITRRDGLSRPFRSASTAGAASSAGHGSSTQSGSATGYGGSTGAGTDHMYSGAIPSCQLRFGQYCYYRGLISWKTLIDAVCWQRRERPSFGAIAVEKELLNHTQVRSILRLKQQGELIGECCIRLGYLNRAQVQQIFTTQKLQHLPIGKFFIQNGILTQWELDELLASQALHNRRYGAGVID